MHVFFYDGKQGRRYGVIVVVRPPPPPTPSAPPRMFGKQILISAEKLSANAILRPPPPAALAPSRRPRREIQKQVDVLENACT